MWIARQDRAISPHWIISFGVLWKVNRMPMPHKQFKTWMIFFLFINGIEPPFIFNKVFRFFLVKSVLFSIKKLVNRWPTLYFRFYKDKRSTADGTLTLIEYFPNNFKSFCGKETLSTVPGFEPGTFGCSSTSLTNWTTRASDIHSSTWIKRPGLESRHSRKRLFFHRKIFNYWKIINCFPWFKS